MDTRKPLMLLQDVETEISGITEINIVIWECTGKYGTLTMLHVILQMLYASLKYVLQNKDLAGNIYVSIFTLMQTK